MTHKERIVSLIFVTLRVVSNTENTFIDMQETSSPSNDFLKKAATLIEENISNAHFGVSELASAIGMSRSNLLRKIRKLTNLSASQYIRQIRLQSAMEMLKASAYNVSEVSYKVGFGSTSYFIKCFREYYGYPPGEVGKHEDASEFDHDQVKQSMRKRATVLVSVLALTAMIILLFGIAKPFSSKRGNFENSIAVLPFKNDSNDSSNVYLINGLMENLLNDLQQIEDLRVISRTSVEKYRNQTKTIAEIAEELHVNYIVEGSGQKLGNQILLNIQLIEAPRDKHLWSQQYRKEIEDIFDLQRELANQIANEIRVIITPEEEERISKVPTENLIAYDYFLKGYDLFNLGTAEGVVDALGYFLKAVEYDDQFARAYADISISYSLLDFYQIDKKYIEISEQYADTALMLDSKIPQSLISKALIFMNKGEPEKAIPFLERALVFNPNSAMVINTLSDLYTNYVPDTEKYLEYALKGIKIDIAAHDSVEASLIFLHLSNAFIQSGFISEALLYIDKSLKYFPDNLYSQYVKPYIIYARDGDLEELLSGLIEVSNKDMSRYDILQEVGKIYYYQRDYEKAYLYYSKFLDIKEALNLDVYPFENAKIGLVMSEMGYHKEAEVLLTKYKEDADHSQSIYKHLSLAMYASYMDNVDGAIQHLKQFSREEKYQYWILLFLKIEPLADAVKKHPDFDAIFNDLERNFWDRHNEIKASLKEDGLI